MASFTPVGVEAQVKGLGAYMSDLNRMDKAQQNLGKSAGGITKSFTSVGGSVLKFGAIAGGAALVGVKTLAAGVVALGGVALQEYAKFERLSLSVQSLVARELAQGKEVETQRQVVAKLTAEEAKEIEDLNMKIQEEGLERQTMLGRIQEQKQRVIELTAAYGDQGLNVQTAKARLAEMEFELQKSDKATAEMTARINELKGKEGELVTITEKVRTGQMSMSQAMAQASPRAQELLKWIQKLAVESPFDMEGVAMAFRTALAYGFTTEEAQKLTEAEIDFSAATGQGVDTMNQIALALGQMQAKGKVSGQELIQLTNAGIGVNQILEVMGFTLDDVSNGLVDSDKFIQAVIDDMNVFQGAAKGQSETFSGLLNSLEDLKSIGLREFFTGTFQAIQPYVADFVNSLSSMALETGNLRSIGDVFGTYVANGIAIASEMMRYIIDLGRTLFDAFQTGGLGAVFVELGNQIMLAWENIKPVLTQMGTEFFAWIETTAIPFMMEKLSILWTALLTFIDINWPIVVEKLNTLSQSFFDWVNVNVVPQIPTYLGMIVTGISTYLQENWPQIAQTLTTWAELFWDWVQQTIPRAGEMLGNILVAIGSWATGEGSTQLLALGETLGNAMADGIMFVLSNQERMTALVLQLVTGLAVGVAAVTGILIVMGGQIVAGILAGILEKLGIDLQPATFNELGRILTNIGNDIVTIARYIGEQIVEGIKQGILETEFGEFLTEYFDRNVAFVENALGIGSPSTVFAGIGRSLIEGLILGIQEMGGGAITAITDIFSGLFGGGDGGGGVSLIPDFSTALLSLTEFQVKFIEFSTLFQETLILWGENLLLFDLAIQNLYLMTIPTLQETFMIFSFMFQEQMIVLDQAVIMLDTLITKLSNVTLVNLQASVTTVFALFKTELDVTTAKLVTLTAKVDTFITRLNAIAPAAHLAGAHMIWAFSGAESKLVSLIPRIKEMDKALSKVADKAKKIILAFQLGSAGAGGMGAYEGVGFQGGTGALGFRVPSGFPNDTYPIWTTSGERVVVAPRGHSIEEMVGPRMNSGMVARRVDVTVNVGSVNNGMDLAMLSNFIQEAVSEGI